MNPRGPTHPAVVPLIVGIALMAALAPPTWGAWMMDARQLRGVSLWDKPLKFELSLGLHLATLWVALRWLPQALPALEQAVVRTATTVVAFFSVSELLYIALQAARGRESHFNRDTALEAFLYYGAMGPGALAILAGTAAIGWVLWRHLPRQREGLQQGTPFGMALGLMAGSAATLVAVVPLSAGLVDGLGHWVGGVHTDAGGLPLAGWSRTGGDLRVPHFFATHLVQALPLAGWLADRFAPTQARRVPWVVLVAGLVLVALTLAQAIAGQPFIGGPQ